MMSTEGFLAKLRRLDIRVWVEDGRLRCSAPEGTLTPALQAELSQRKSEILALQPSPAAAAAPATPPIARIDRTRKIPPSFGQQRLWFIERMAPGVAVYNITSPICLRGELDVAALQRSLREIVA